MLACAIAMMAWGGLARAEQSIGYPLITSYSADDIGADPSSWHATQDDSGVINFGAKDLLSFDGERWHIYSPPGTSRIRFLLREGDDKMWTGTADDLGWFDRTTTGWAFHSLREHIPPEHRAFGEIFSIFRQGNTVVFFAHSRVFQWDGKELKVWHNPSTRPLLGFAVGGELFFQHRPNGLYKLTAGQPELVVPGTVLKETSILWLEAHPSGWFAITNRGMGILTRDDFTVFEGTANDFLRPGRGTGLVRLPDDTFAISSQVGGIGFVRRDGSLDRVLTEKEGLPHSNISGLFLDRDGALWATSYSHIIRIDLKGRSTLFDQRANLPKNLYHRLAIHEGTVFAGTHGSVYQLDLNNNSAHEITGMRARMSSLRSTPEGLLGASMQAVFRLAGGEVTKVAASMRNIYDVLPVGDGTYLTGEDDAVALHGENISATDTSSDLAAFPGLALSLVKDHAGRLWVGTEKSGPWVLESNLAGPGQPKSAAPLLGLPEIRGKAIVRAGPRGEVYVFTAAGAWIVQADATLKVAGFPLRPVDNASEITSAGTAWLLFAGSAAAKPMAGCVSIISGQPVWQAHSVDGFERVGYAQSIAIQETATAATVVWIGGSLGVLRHLVDTPSAPRPGPPLVTAVTYSKLHQAQKLSATLPYATDKIVLEYAAPDYARRPMLRIETKVDGLDSEWASAPRDPRQELSGLRDGSYVLRARVVDEFGQASEEARFAFTVLPPWWRTQGALIGMVLGLVASGYGAYRLRMQALRRRNAKLEEKVRRRTRELEAANAAKTQFVANMSHDIRNPLNGIQGMTLALEDMDPTPRQAQAIATLRECATYLTSLVDDVLDFAHIEAGKVELRPRAFVPGELLRSVAATLQADAAAGGARLSIEVGPGLPERLMGDAGRIQQILVNYASNALKYAGGHIRLSAAARTGATGEVEFAVHDDGPGIDLEEQATLFTKFTRLARDRATEIPGSGLGLASCRLLADLMGGAVGVMSQPGAGARFFLRLPIAVATEADATPAFALPNTTVLLVEDTDYKAQAAAAVLARLGLTCERARTGAEALAMFRQKRFNLVLLDRNLPDMDGTEVARQMRATESDGLPAILLAVTAYCTADDRRLCLEAGMDAFVGKPLTPEKLRRVLLTASRRLLGTASVEAAGQRPEFPNRTGFDLSMLTLLADDAERMEDQIDRYLETLDDYARALADAANDPATLITAAHRLVGHARLIAATALGTAARELEDAARAGQAEDIETLSERTLKEVRATTAALRLYRSPAPSA